jgi:hypothetical protein
MVAPIRSFEKGKIFHTSSEIEPALYCPPMAPGATYLFWREKGSKFRKRPRGCPSHTPKDRGSRCNPSTLLPDPACSRDLGRGDEKSFIVSADEKLAAFLKLESQLSITE